MKDGEVPKHFIFDEMYLIDNFVAFAEMTN